MRFEHIFGIEVAHAAAAPRQGLLPRAGGHEASEVLYPHRILVTVAIDRHLICVLRHIYRVTPLALIVEESLDVTTDLQLVLACGDICDLTRYWI